jgi:ABC-type oligopeptide transport system substrate-binding subunit
MSKVSRRKFLSGLGMAAAGAAVAACQPKTVVVKETVEVEKVVKETVEVQVEKVVEKEVTKVVEKEKVVEVTAAAPTGPTNALGITLSADALPLEEQYIRIGIGTVGGGYGHIMESLYNRAFEHNGGYETLTTLDIDLNVQGVGAESWAPSEDGSYWDFNLRKGLMFSNGKPVTAHDWVYTMQWSLGHGYDFAWFYFDIKNAAKVATGELPPEELGMEAVDDYTLRIYTEAPVPYLPMLGVWWEVMSDKAQEELGENWALDPERFVSSGPFILTKFERGIGHKWELNTKYAGVRNVYMTEIREETLPTGLPAYLAGELQTYGINANTPAAEVALVNSNPVLRAESHPQPPTGTDYIGFNTLGLYPELANRDVRLALCKAIDKADLVAQIFQGFAHPAWGILPPGFPNYNPELEQLDPNVYDPEAAQRLLAEAGFPGGQGFPKFELYIRQPNAKQVAICEAVQARWKENLGIDIDLRPSDFQSFTSASFTEKTAPMYYVNYNNDYNDPATFLNVFRSKGGRHPHDDPAWDELYNAANSSFDPQARFSGMAEAERLMVDSCAWFFMLSPFGISLWKCNAQGSAVQSNKDGYAFFGGGGQGCIHAYEDTYWSQSDCRKGL